MGLSVMSCAVHQFPSVSLAPLSVGEGGRILRDLYRSYWVPPTQDAAVVRVGLVESGQSIKFKTLGQTRLRFFGENEVTDIISPKNTVWKIDRPQQTRPAVVTYLTAIKNYPKKPQADFADTLQEEWFQRGYPELKWMGSPPMDQEKDAISSGRWVLSLKNFSQLNIARAYCQTFIQKWNESCQVLRRTELPPLGKMHIQSQGGEVSKTFEGFLHILPSKSGILLKDFQADIHTSAYAKKSSEIYDHDIFVLINTHQQLSMVQSLELQEYLKSVVPSEIFSKAHPNALAAQAVIARTYTLKHEQKGTGTDPFNICGTTSCQVYRGKTYQTEATDSAIRATKDLMLWEAAMVPAMAYYHSFCGGHTESIMDAFFQGRKNYLLGSSDWVHRVDHLDAKKENNISALFDKDARRSYCGLSSFNKDDKWQWEIRLDRSALETLGKQYALKGPVSEIEVIRRGLSGRVTYLKLKSKHSSAILKGELKIRKAFGGLKSSLFKVAMNPNGELVLTGRGYGHGVGMCQYGAIGRAEAGQTYVQILEAYYPGTFVSKASWTYFL